MLSTVVLSNENQTCRDWEAPTSTGGGRMSLIIVFLQFSIKFYFSGCLVLIINSKLMIFVGKRRGFPILTNCGFGQSEKRKNTISQMRLRSVFKMRTSILNTATTEQMGYGIFSFFVYTKSTNQYLNSSPVSCSYASLYFATVLSITSSGRL